MSLQLYDEVSQLLSKRLTRKYSTSFSLGIRLINKEYRWAIYSIYGLVRIADEIVDTFHHQDKEKLLKEFREETYKAISNGLSVNPILNSFQRAAQQFEIGPALIDPFFDSMEMDLSWSQHGESEYKQYIYGSAEVVGLMCLKVFCNGDQQQYKSLKASACKLGSAFQKVNFLRDIKSDFEDRGRVYFPNLEFNHFDNEVKQQIIRDIRYDFSQAYEGILRLPLNCRLGVYTAFRYYNRLLDKIEREPAEIIRESRVRVPDREKISLLLQSYWLFKTGAIKHE